MEPDEFRMFIIQSAAVPEDTGSVAPAPDYTRTVTTHSTAAPGDTGIAIEAPDYTQVFTVVRQHLLDTMA